MKKVLIVMLVSMIFSKCLCKKDEEFFMSSAEIFDYYPKRNTFYVGDTIFFKITIPKVLEGEYYTRYYGDIRRRICTIKETDSLPVFYNLMLDMYGKNIDGVFVNGKSEYSLSKERVVNIKGRLTDSKEFPSIFERADSNYVLEVGYIFKYAGGGGIRYSSKYDFYPMNMATVLIDKEYINCDKRIMLHNTSDHDNYFGTKMEIGFLIKER